MIILFSLFFSINSQLLEKLQQTDDFYLVHTYKNQTVFLQLQNQLKDILKVRYLNCEKENDQICQKEEVAYIISKNKQHKYENELQINAISNFTKYLIPDQSIVINDKLQLNEYLNSYLPKVILFTNKKETGTLFKYLAFKFKDFKFLVIQSENQELIQQFNIQKYPQILLINNDNEIINYNDKNDIESISQFLTKQENLQKINNFDDYQDYILQEQKMVIINVFKKGDKQGSLKQIQQKFGRMIKYYGYEVKEGDTFAKDNFKIKKIPSLIFYPFSTDKKPIQLDNDVQIEQLIEIVNQNIVDETVYISQVNFEREMQEAFSLNKQVFLLFIQKETPISYKILSKMEQYNKKILFAAFVNPPQDLQERFNIQKFPSLTILSRKDESNNGQVAVHKYPGKIHYDELTIMLYQISGGSMIDEQPKQLVVNRVNSQEQFQSYCQGLCIIGLINGQNQQLQLQQSQILKNLRKKNQSDAIQFVQIDGLCHSEILQQIDTDQIPYLFVYQPQKDKIFQMFGTFEEEGLEIYIQKVLQGKLTGQKIQKKLVLQDKDCNNYQKYEL